MISRRFMPVGIMHRGAVKGSASCCGVLATCREGTFVAFAEVVMMIDVAVEVGRPVKPWPRSDKNTIYKPLWTVVAVGSTGVWRNFIVSVRTLWRRPDTDRHLRRCATH